VAGDVVQEHSADFVLPRCSLGTVFVCLAWACGRGKRRVRHRHFYRAGGLCGEAGVLTAILRRVSARGRGHFAPDQAQPGLWLRAADAPQHAAVWGLHHPYRRGDYRSGAGRLGLQSPMWRASWGCRQAGDRSLHLGASALREDSTANYNSEYACWTSSRRQKQFQMPRRSGFIWPANSRRPWWRSIRTSAWDLYVV